MNVPTDHGIFAPDRGRRSHDELIAQAGAGYWTAFGAAGFVYVGFSFPLHLILLPMAIARGLHE